MRKGTVIFLAAFVLFFATASTAQQPRGNSRYDEPDYDLAEMYKMHFTRVNADFATGGQPPLDELARLKAQGFKSILNLRHPDESPRWPVKEEKAEAARLGMRYFHVPVDFENPQPAQADEFLRITDDPANRPMLIHCTMAVRVGAFWMIRRVLRDAWPVDKAEEEATKIGLGARHLKKFARDYIAQHGGAKSSPGAAARGSMLVSPGWVAERLQSGKLVLLHVGVKEEYDAEHLPGAQYIALNQITREGPGQVPFELPPVEELTERLRQWGVSDDSHIVVYFGKDWVTPTTRVYLTLDYLGLAGRAAVLSGGMPAWKAAGFPVTAEVPVVARGNFTPQPQPNVIVTADWVLSNLKKPGISLVDARTAAFYTGEDDARGRYPRPGHIPGAVNVSYRDVLLESGALKETSALEELFRAAGVKPGDRVVTYCHIGQQASLLYFVARYLGYDAAMYDGSFTEWTAKELPVEKSPAKPDSK